MNTNTNPTSNNTNTTEQSFPKHCDPKVLGQLIDNCRLCYDPLNGRVVIFTPDKQQHASIAIGAAIKDMVDGGMPIQVVALLLAKLSAEFVKDLGDKIPLEEKAAVASFLSNICASGCGCAEFYNITRKKKKKKKKRTTNSLVCCLFVQGRKRFRPTLKKINPKPI